MNKVFKGEIQAVEEFHFSYAHQPEGNFIAGFSDSYGAYLCYPRVTIGTASRSVAKFLLDAIMRSEDFLYNVFRLSEYYKNDEYNILDYLIDLYRGAIDIDDQDFLDALHNMLLGFESYSDFVARGNNILTNYKEKNTKEKHNMKKSEKKIQKIKEEMNMKKETKCIKPDTKTFKFTAKELTDLLAEAGCNLEGYEVTGYYCNDNEYRYSLSSIEFEAVLDG
ncbi:hypothetical protein [Cognatishimia sp.]|uniref:hypothetical protein n=1 Tax=Cognatishimia sp. TaxID=2211648 RepID=UPI003516A60B|nr:hypothetical protein [Cognatishimia sp.]